MQDGDIVLEAYSVQIAPLDMSAVKALAGSLKVRYMTVREYADNSQRGTYSVRHWRIKGD